MIWIVSLLLTAVCAFNFWAIYVLAKAVLTLQQREADRLREELQKQNENESVRFVRLNGFVQTSTSVH